MDRDIAEFKAKAHIPTKEEAITNITNNFYAWVAEEILNKYANGEAVCFDTKTFWGDFGGNSCELHIELMTDGTIKEWTAGNDYCRY